MRVHARQRTSAFVTLAAAIAAALSPAAHADKVHFDIASGPAQQTLSQFISQTGLQLLFDFEAVKGLTTRAVSGEFEARDALAQMLQDTGFMFEFVNERTVAIVKPGTTAKPAASTTRAGEYTRLAQADSSSSRSPAVAVSAGDTSDRRSQGSLGASIDAPSSRIELEEIVVTGTHLRGVTIDGPSPVVVYDRKDIERSGAASLADFVSRLPQSVSSDVSDTAAATRDGAKAINLRGLGEGATLVLVDGRRQQVGAVSQANGNEENYVNLNVIPFGAVERVEILTDGGSAIYGSDAVGGIVNIILRKDFNGLESNTRYGNTTRQDLQEISQSLLGGLSTDNLSVLFSADYYDRDELLVRDRDQAMAPLLSAVPPADQAAVPAVPGNVFAVSGNLPGLNSSYAAVPRGQDGRNLTVADFAATQGTLNPLVPNGSLHTLYAPQERKSGHVRLGYTVTDNLDLFANGSINHLRNRYQDPRPINLLRVPAANPFNPFGADVLVSFYFPDSRHTETITEDYGTTAGFDYRHSDRLRFDGYVAWSESLAHSESYDINPSVAATNAAVTAALARTDRNTALNVFGDDLGNLPNVMDQITLNTASQDGKMSSRAAAAKMEMSLLDLPAGVLKGVVGGERREEDHHYTAIGRTTAAFTRTEYAPTRDVNSAFVEIAVPLLKDSLGVQAADLSLAGRYDDYSDFGNTLNWQAGLAVRPVSSLLLRARYGTSFIAPSFSQSFLAETSQQLPQIPQLVIFDPVLNASYNFATLVNGGNPELTPQTADTWSAGFVIEPARLANLRFTLNWYRIDYQDKIRFLSFRELPPFESLFPENFVRNPVPLPGESVGRITQIRQGPVNVSRVETSGIDANLSYRFDTAIGRFEAALAATHVLHYRTQLTPATPMVEAVDTAGNPKSWEASTSLFYSRGHFSIGPQVTYTHSYRTVGTPAIKLVSTTIASLQSSYEYEPASQSAWFKSLRIAAGLYNAFDEMPSVDGSSVGFDFTEGDLRGRQYYVTLNARF